MSTPKELIESGLLEVYILGSASPEEREEVEAMAAAFSEVAEEMERIELAMENYALANAITPDPAIKAFIVATIDYIDRLKGGERFEHAPILSKNSKITDYSAWLKRADMYLPESVENFFAKAISCTPAMLTAIVWARKYTPKETHSDIYESFLILEGSCEVTIGEEVIPLTVGDFLTIPLHKTHSVKVTSEMPCKAILQRVAA